MFYFFYAFKMCKYNYIPFIYFWQCYSKMSNLIPALSDLPLLGIHVLCEAGMLLNCQPYFCEQNEHWFTSKWLKLKAPSAPCLNREMYCKYKHNLPLLCVWMCSLRQNKAPEKAISWGQLYTCIAKITDSVKIKCCSILPEHSSVE